jgi:hypothetical protein
VPLALVWTAGAAAVVWHSVPLLFGHSVPMWRLMLLLPRLLGIPRGPSALKIKDLNVDAKNKVHHVMFNSRILRAIKHNCCNVGKDADHEALSKFGQRVQAKAVLNQCLNEESSPQSIYRRQATALDLIRQPILQVIFASSMS